MKILIITETLSVGGAETFVVRLANSLSLQHEVMLVNLHPEISRKELIARLVPSVRYSPMHQPFRAIRQKTDGLMLKIGVDISLIDEYIIKFIYKILRQFNPDVIHTHLFKADYYLARLKARGYYSGNLVSTNHGDYIEYDKVSPKRIINYDLKKRLTLKMLNYLVVISDEQAKWAKIEKLKSNADFQYPKIINGYESSEQMPVIRHTVGIPNEAFIFGMVARGIKPKGWSFLVEAFIDLNEPNSHLVLVGEGQEISRLQKDYSSNNNISFVGFTDNPISWINIFDVGILPSVLKSESLPTVVIEYLYCGKPVIATDIGEIRRMLGSDNEAVENFAGTIIPTEGDDVEISLLTKAMHQMMYDTLYYNHCKKNATAAAAKFSMTHCVAEYEKIYKGL